MEETPEDHMQMIQPLTKKAKIARVRYPNWEKQETIILVKAYQRQMDEFMTATSKGRMAASEQKWDRISSLCAKEGVSRDAEQCRKRWQDLSKNYKRIKEWEGAAEAPSFWFMSSSNRKDKNLPGNFDREIYDCMDIFMGSKTAIQLQRLLSSKARCDSLNEDHELPGGCLEGRSREMLAYVEPHGDPSSQEDSWTLSKERTIPSRDYRKNNNSPQADSRSDPIAEAVENATRLAQEQCSAQLTEILAEVLLKMADAMKTVAENIRKRPR